jgi:integrase
MGRSAEIRIQNKLARASLPARASPYWRAVVEGCHIGYYRGTRTGKWLARVRKADGRAYATCTLGEADDEVPANGKTILDWKQAFDKAMQWAELQAQGSAETNPGLTIKQAVTSYIERRDEQFCARVGRAGHCSSYYALTRFVLKDAKLPQTLLAELTEADLYAWQKRIHSRAVTSLQRVANDLKAALNAAWVMHRKALPSDLPITIKYGLRSQVGVQKPKSVARDNQILTDDQVRKIVAAAVALDEDGDFARLVVVLAATGARFAQVTRMTVRDVQVERSRLMVPQSFKGDKGGTDLIRVPVGKDTLEALAPILEGRGGDEPLLEVWRYKQISPTKWVRNRRGPWKTASEMLRRWNQAAAAAGIPTAIPYALRHSSIVRGLRFGLPIRLVAALHDTSVTMIERHYSRWIAEGLDDMAALAVVPIFEKKLQTIP